MVLLEELLDRYYRPLVGNGSRDSIRPVMAANTVTLALPFAIFVLKFGDDAKRRNNTSADSGSFKIEA
jgi:hypothetical protein